MNPSLLSQRKKTKVKERKGFHLMGFYRLVMLFPWTVLRLDPVLVLLYVLALLGLLFGALGIHHNSVFVPIQIGPSIIEMGCFAIWYEFCSFCASSLPTILSVIELTYCSRVKFIFSKLI